MSVAFTDKVMAVNPPPTGDSSQCPLEGGGANLREQARSYTESSLRPVLADKARQG
ncbi:hypothetical protein D9M70_474370 [compost metagenome]